MKNKVRYGLEQLHIAFVSEAGTWESPIQIPGVVNFTANPDGGESTFFADNIKYYTRQTNNGYTGDVEVALFPDEVIAEMLGWEVDANGMLVEDAEGEPKEFALMGQIQGDAKNRRFVYYRCTAGRPSQTSGTTTDTVTPNTETLSLVILPLEHGGKKIVKGVIEPNETNQALYNSFFNAVTVPNAEPATVNKDGLEAAIVLAESLIEENYTAGSWTAVSTALAAAEGVSVDDEATQAEVNAATTTLQTAILNLVAEV